MRFTTIDGLQRNDLAVAGEVWLDDVFKSSWASRDVMKIATHLVRYMSDANHKLLRLSGIESQLQISTEHTMLALRMLQMFGAVEAFSLDRDESRVGLNLTSLQRLRVLETRSRLDLITSGRQRGATGQEGRWLPEMSQAALAEDGAQPADRPDAVA